MADSWHCGPQKVAIEHLLHLPVARRPQTRQRPSLCKEARLALYRQVSIDRRRQACASATLAMQLLSSRCRGYLFELCGSALLDEAAIEERGTQRLERRENPPIREPLLLFSQIWGETRAQVGKVESDILLAANQSRTSRQLQNDVTDVYRLERCTFSIFYNERRGGRKQRGNSPCLFLLAAKMYSHYIAAACSTLFTSGTMNKGAWLGLVGAYAPLVASSCL